MVAWRQKKKKKRECLDFPFAAKKKKASKVKQKKYSFSVALYDCENLCPILREKQRMKAFDNRELRRKEEIGENVKKTIFTPLQILLG